MIQASTLSHGRKAVSPREERTHKEMQMRLCVAPTGGSQLYSCCDPLIHFWMLWQPLAKKIIYIAAS